MRISILAVLCLGPLFALSAWSQEGTPTDLSCDDFKPTPAALERFPDLVGACEAVVDRNGELYGRFRAIVRRANMRSVTLYLPATDHTFTVRPESDARVLIENRRVRPRDLQRGQEIRIYLSATAFATQNIEEVSMVTDTGAGEIVTYPVQPAEALPTTASYWPTLALASILLFGVGFAMRGRAVAG